MGCDIHLVLERKNGAKWVAVNTFNSHESAYGRGWSCPLARDRNYERFAALAGVRGTGPEPRGLPADISETARLLADDWGGAGHSHSWLPIKDATKVFLDTEHRAPEPDSIAAKYPSSHYFGVDDEESAGDYRLVFWFDN